MKSSGGLGGEERIVSWEEGDWGLDRGVGGNGEGLRGGHLEVRRGKLLRSQFNSGFKCLMYKDSKIFKSELNLALWIILKSKMLKGCSIFWE